MNVKDRLKSKRYFLPTVLVLLFAVALVATASVTGVFATQAVGATTAQSATYQERGLIGFEGDYALSSDDSPVSVIVTFESQPAAVQIHDAQIEGRSLSESAAERAVEDDHSLFRQELSALFSNVEGARTAPTYEILWEYRFALNGVNIVLPSNMVEEVASFDSVRAIYPDFILELEQPPVVEQVDIDALVYEARADRNPVGMAAGRAAMRADDLHALDYRGEDVVIVMLDSGINYEHPAFEGAFLTIEEMQARGVNINNDYGVNIDGTYYYLGRNFLQGPFEQPINNPSEVRPGVPLATTPTTAGGTNHGTFVAGIMLGRDTGGSGSVLGIAPEARLITYRLLNRTQDASDVATGSMTASMERVVIDRADVVNMSFGVMNNNANAPQSIIVNNVMLANPNMVFIAAGGNSGPDPFTVTTPGPGSKYITAANINIGTTTNLPTNVLCSSQWTVNNSSSRGPAAQSFEIKPELGAHGTNVFSTFPIWPEDCDYVTGQINYGIANGTSAAAPQIAGAAALLVDHSRQSGNQWSANEIKTRMMNTAQPFGENTSQEISVFDTGAGFVDVYAAMRADANVAVHFDRVMHGWVFGEFIPQNFTTTETGSFSFGNVGNLGDTCTLSLLSEPSPNIRTLQASITNNADVGRTFAFDYHFINNPEYSMALTFSHDAWIWVGPGETAEFSVTASVGNREGSVIEEGFFEGYIYVRANPFIRSADCCCEEFTARLPFALVNENTIEVPAYRLSFHICGCCGTSRRYYMSCINVPYGENILDFLTRHHEGFSTDNIICATGRFFTGWDFLYRCSHSNTFIHVPLEENTTMPAGSAQIIPRWGSGHAVQVSAGTYHNLVIDSAGTLWTWGRNNYGQLGLGDAIDRDIPIRVPDEGMSGYGWTEISAGKYHSVGIRDDGSLWAWGRNNYGQLGTGSTSATPALSPVQVSTSEMTGEGWQKISTGDYHTLAAQSGTLWVWGRNNYGQLGLGDTLDRAVPTKIYALGTQLWACAMAAGGSHSAISFGGELWVWGSNDRGQLGLGDFTDRLLPVSVPAPNYPYGHWECVTAGSRHTIARQGDDLWAWGANDQGQLGIGSLSQSVPIPTKVSSARVSGDAWISLDAGEYHTVATRWDGSLWAWGSGSDNRLGMQSALPVTTPTRVQPTTGTGMPRMSAGGSHSLAIGYDGSIWTWGNNDFGQLGVGDTAQHLGHNAVLSLVRYDE